MNIIGWFSLQYVHPLLTLLEYENLGKNYQCAKKAHRQLQKTLVQVLVKCCMPICFLDITFALRLQMIQDS